MSSASSIFGTKAYHAYIGMNNYCNRCGQKLDWREEE